MGKEMGTDRGRGFPLAGRLGQDRVQEWHWLGAAQLTTDKEFLARSFPGVAGRALMLEKQLQPSQKVDMDMGKQV
jgi:hypothetical protein